MADLITIPKDKIPSKMYSISFRVPVYDDYRSARKRYPANDRQDVRVPYSVEEMLLAMCMEKVNDQKLLYEQADIIERLNPFPIADRQFLVRVFLELFFMTREEATQARDLAEQMAQVYQSEYTLPAKYLPSRSKSVTVHTPNTQVQMEADKRYSGSSNMGASLEEILLAYCISAIDGQPVTPNERDVAAIMSQWSIADVQFLGSWFVNLFCIDDKGAEDAARLGKELKASLIGSSASTKAKGSIKSD